MNKKSVTTWGVRLGSISLAVGLAAYMSAQEGAQQQSNIPTLNQQQQNKQTSSQNDTLAPQQNEQSTGTQQQFDGRRGGHGARGFGGQSSEGQVNGNVQSGDAQVSGQSSTTQSSSNAPQSGQVSSQQSTQSFDTMTRGS